MAKAHTVEIVQSFTHETKLGALVVGDKEIAPASVHKSEYVVGQRHTFHNKVHAMGFCKAHGDKVKYIGKV